ncbi:Hypothetical protein PBC10988_21530 [Planctomycetales bacterium 10988]|nr:Hypothetical protein PBC10988_21530 [Planctomycetales bacterium 10988]
MSQSRPPRPPSSNQPPRAAGPPPGPPSPNLPPQSQPPAPPAPPAPPQAGPPGMPTPPPPAPPVAGPPTAKPAMARPAVARPAMAQPAGSSLEPPSEFAFASEGSSIAEMARKKRGFGWMTYVVLLLFLGAIGTGLYFGLVSPTITIAELEEAPPQVAKEMEAFVFAVPFKLSEGISDEDLTFEMLEGPEGAAINDMTGRITWTPQEEQSPGTHLVKVRLSVKGQPDLTNERSYQLVTEENNQPPTMEAIPDQEIRSGETLKLKFAASDPDNPPAEMEFFLKTKKLTGMYLHPETGEFEWKVMPAEGERIETITVSAKEALRDGLSAERTFYVKVLPMLSELEELVAKLEGPEVKIGWTNELNATLPLRGTMFQATVNSESLKAFEYFTADQAADESLDIAPNAVMVAGAEPQWAKSPHFYRYDRWIFLYEGDSAPVLSALRRELGDPIAEGKPSDPSAMMAKSEADSETPAGPDAFDDRVLDLFKKNRLLSTREYPTLRKIAADRFADKYSSEIEMGLGDSQSPLRNWLKEHPEIQEELYVALDPELDQIVPALTVFRQLYEAFPEEMETYGDLAIATAVTWDNPDAVYSYERHQERTRSTLPETPQLDAVENFRYFLEKERIMQGRAKFLPWEFLVHLINHRTPLDERDWAVKQYLPKRTMFGECYENVPYDTEMLTSGGEVCRLANKEYTLPNLVNYGGVCAMQADFAARVGKSLGVPAEYVRGESNSQGLHAWVMWVEVKSVNQGSIKFTLESHGRYNIDKYYVGTLLHPQTGQQWTDRELELQLQTVGLDPKAARHAELAMATFPLIQKEEELNVTEQLQFLIKVQQLSPGNQAAWFQIAEMCRRGDFSREHTRQLTPLFERMFRTFAQFPDFTWKVFPDLAEFIENFKTKMTTYERLVDLYEAQERPDLAAEARLKMADLYQTNNMIPEAIAGLVVTVKKFPDEGRYVPQMLDRIESLVQTDQSLRPQMLQFYQELVPKVPRYRGDTPSQYCMELYERVIRLFNQSGRARIAEVYQQELDRMRINQPQ